MKPQHCSTIGQRPPCAREVLQGADHVLVRAGYDGGEEASHAGRSLDINRSGDLFGGRGGIVVINTGKTVYLQVKPARGNEPFRGFGRRHHSLDRLTLHSNIDRLSGARMDTTDCHWFVLYRFYGSSRGDWCCIRTSKCAAFSSRPLLENDKFELHTRTWHDRATASMPLCRCLSVLFIPSEIQ